MKRYLYPAKWISVQVGRLLHTKRMLRFIYRLHVSNQNWAGFKTLAQKPTQNTQRSKPRYWDSVFNASYLARESTTKRYSQSTTIGRLLRHYTASTSFRSTRRSGRITRRSNPKQEQRFFQRNFRNHCQTSRITWEAVKAGEFSWKPS